MCASRATDRMGLDSWVGEDANPEYFPVTSSRPVQIRRFQLSTWSLTVDVDNPRQDLLFKFQPRLRQLINTLQNAS